MRTKVKIISGPTCSGKSARAVEYALQNNAEIISCDSVQVYKYMDIGSAKLSPSEMRGIKHHLIDVCAPSEMFDVSKYVEYSKKAVAEILAKGKNIVVAGGSPFYLKAWFCAVIDDIHVPSQIRQAVRNIELLGGADALKEELLKLDCSAANFVDMENPRRTARAIERILASGKKLADIVAEFKAKPCPFGDIERDVEILDLDNAEIEERIAKRTKTMLENGLLAECEKLLDLGVKNNPSATGAIGYKECFAAIESGNVDADALFCEISKNTLKLVKKQRKFLRGILRQNF